MVQLTIIRSHDVRPGNCHVLMSLQNVEALLIMCEFYLDNCSDYRNTHSLTQY
jgi:hypothetical protein